MKMSDQIKRFARNAKKAGKDRDKLAPTKQPFRDIYFAEWDRYQPKTPCSKA